MKAQTTASCVLTLFGCLSWALVDASTDLHHHHLRQRNLKECSQVSSVVGAFCSPDLDEPVVCKGDCEYGNFCLSVAAGFPEFFCELAGAEPGEPPITTSPVCPENLLLPCTGTLTPVVCSGGCVYDNICVAVGAGRYGCMLVPDTPVDPPVVTCPVGGPVPCPAIFAPVLCDGICSYPAICEARAAGYTDDQCVPDDPEPPPPLCPVTGPAVSCFNTADPVVCGVDDCVYGNLCLAIGANFTENECGAQCPIGNRGFVKCPEVYEPVLCDGVCVYDNQCSAQAGPGFTEEDCEPLKEPVDPNVNPKCAQLDLDRFCIEIFAPVVCDGCEFENSCWAEGAGFAEDQCVPVEKPLPVPVDPTVKPECKEPDPGFCIALYDPYVCDGCVYSNSCVAEGAGYSDISVCERLEEPVPVPVDPALPLPPVVEVNPNGACPQPPQGTPVPLVYSPVLCDGRCEYGNVYTAVAAGYEEEDCSSAP
jgi:hypothetical protein